MEAAKIRRSTAERLWGRMAAFGMSARIVSLAFAAAAIVAMSFTQLGFWSIGAIDGRPVYLMTILAPLAMGSLMFGPITGALLGLLAGGVLFAHATFFPLDFYEVYLMSPLNTFALLTVLGALAGWSFSLVLRREPQGAARAGLIAAVCVAVSFAASGLMIANTVIAYGGLESVEAISEFLLNSPLGANVQALVDAALMVILCWVADAVVRSMVSSGSARRLFSVFSSWMFAVSAIVFMLTSAAIFSLSTLQAQKDAEAIMSSEIEYLERQLSSRGGTGLDALLDGYNVEIDGWVVIMGEGGAVQASDDDVRFAKGSSFIEQIGYGALEESDAVLLDALAQDSDGLSVLQAVGEDGAESMDVVFLSVEAYDGGYVAMLRSSDMVYAGRPGVMASSTLLALALVAGIAAVATVLLNRVVVSRIDETNDSLDKITRGNLNERVSVRDSREFASLSNGINTTVSALKDSIAEAERRNAQELATAKAIQESALPREFPPFPEIDRFDIYASMKTTKEVGGDFYDFFLIDERRLGFVIADVSGKGIPAALLMMSAKTQIESYMMAGLDIGEAIGAANHQLCLGNDEGMFVTACACVLDFETGELSCVNAGHNPPMLLHGGAWEWLRDVSGMPLGLVDGIPYKRFARQLAPEDVLYLYTDGVTEAINAAGELFGEERLEGTLRRYAAMNPRSIGVGVRRAITDFTLDCEQPDDMTMLILKYGVPPERKAVMILPATDDQLVHVWNFIHEELKRRRAPNSVRNPLDIAAEELFVNVCHYAYPDATPENPGEVRISFEYEANPPSLTVQIADDGIAYNPMEKPDAATPDGTESAPVGGLGILMAKRSVDDMTYERVGGSNVVTFVKKW